MTHSKKLPWLGACGLIAIGALVLALTLGARSEAGAAPDVQPSFTVLTSGPAPELTANERRALAGLATLQPDYGIRVEDARLARVVDGMKVLAVPAADRVCVVALHTTDERAFAPATCATTASANRGGVVLRLGTGSPFTVVGLAPDGANVSLAAGADTTRLDVVGNAYVAVSDADSATVTVTSPGAGAVSHSLAIE